MPTFSVLDDIVLKPPVSKTKAAALEDEIVGGGAKQELPFRLPQRIRQRPLTEQRRRKSKTCRSRSNMLHAIFVGSLRVQRTQ